ncbi:uncharacterized protein LOC108628837 [Ceratina calcarata]|uniref:Uncharacterized protein LOC108628837 n=1 Tax=Ceratina calcarata TaxID=156304 RepID=A0AAJ7NB32_9HYME|nr:uncharacterized protein LOC108628837 [Ceratina calcarata]
MKYIDYGESGSRFRPNTEVSRARDTSSMSGKLEYLEKYSVAPSPSRDYYGLRVDDDQVTLYLWRISHGPHKSPVVRTSGFADFNQDLRLQDEIRRIFGEYLLKHINNIACGRYTLLTLPKCLIKKLIKYLTVHDIIKLSSLSHTSKEIFDNNFVWEALYKKYKPFSTRNKYDKLRISNWKQLFQFTQIEGLTNDKKMLRPRTNIRQQKPATKIENPTRLNARIENLSKSNPRIEQAIKYSSSNSRITSKTVQSESQIAKRFIEPSHRKTAPSSIARKLSDNRLNQVNTEKEKSSTEKKAPTIKSLQMAGQKNMKSLREQSLAKTDSKRDLDNKDLPGNKIPESKANRVQNKVRKVETKASSQSVKATEDKLNLKNRSTTAPRISSNRIERISRPIQDQGKSKPKSKTKKIGQSKSTILSTSTDLLSEHCAVKDDSFDLADLIEASLKNIRSPRSIFDYSFSCLDKPKSCAGDTKAQDIVRKMTDHPRSLKSSRIRAPLDRLSEKSEPLTGKSMDSARRNEDGTSNVELKKSMETKHTSKVPVVPEEKAEHFERYGIYNKFAAMQNNSEQKKPTPTKEIDKMSVLRSIGTRTLPGKPMNSGAGEINRNEVRKTINNVYKYL